MGYPGAGGQPQPQPMQPMNGVAQPGMQQPGMPAAPPGIPPQLAAIWQHLPPQIQALFGGGGAAAGAGGAGPLAGLLGGGGGGASPFAGLLSALHPHPQAQAPPGKMIASGNPYPVQQTY